MRFTYIGDEVGTTAFGLSFPRGVAVEVTDEHACRKLSHNQFFALVVQVEGVSVEVTPEPKKRGRPRKVE